MVAHTCKSQLFKRLGQKDQKVETVVQHALGSSPSCKTKQPKQQPRVVVAPATYKAEARGWLKPVSSRPAWAKKPKTLNKTLQNT